MKKLSLFVCASRYANPISPQSPNAPNNSAGLDHTLLDPAAVTERQKARSADDEAGNDRDARNDQQVQLANEAIKHLEHGIGSGARSEGIRGAQTSSIAKLIIEALVSPLHTAAGTNFVHTVVETSQLREVQSVKDAVQNLLGSLPVVMEGLKVVAELHPVLKGASGHMATIV